jgi:zinc protease
VKEFFRLYYAPNNATLAIVGDFNPAQAKQWVTKYFADIPRGTPIERPTVTPVTMTDVRRVTFEDRVQVPRLYLAWPTVGEDNADDKVLDIITSILPGPRTARLTKALVYDAQSAANVGAFEATNENWSQYFIQVTPRPGHSLSELEAQVDSVLERFKREGPTADEMTKATAGTEYGFVSGLESNLSKAELLLRGSVFHGDAGYYKSLYAGITSVTAADVKRVANQYFTPGRVVLSVVPVGKADDAANAAMSRKVTVSADGGHYVVESK